MADHIPGTPDSQDPGPSTPAPPPPTQIVLQQQSSLFGRFGKLLLFALFIAILVILSMAGAYQSYFSPSNGPQEKYHSLSKTATDKVAIVTIGGALLEGDGFVKQQIDQVRNDKNVVAVVLRIDSPGGTVTASDYVYHHLRKLADDRALPMVVSMGSICASGGYYVAMAVGDQPDAIFAEPTTWTGSIGVVIPHYDLSGLLQRWDVKDDSIASHPLKLMGSPTRPMSEKERTILQELVDQSFVEFKDIVLAGRPKFKDHPEELEAVATGQIFTAEQAQENGLVDKIGFIEEAVGRAVELAHKSPEEVRCVKYEKPTTFMDSLVGAQARQSRTLPDLASWLDLATPRAYYLWTWLPALVSNSSSQMPGN